MGASEGRDFSFHIIPSLRRMKSSSDHLRKLFELQLDETGHIWSFHFTLSSSGQLLSFSKQLHFSCIRRKWKRYMWEEIVGSVCKLGVASDLSLSGCGVCFSHGRTSQFPNFEFTHSSQPISWRQKSDCQFSLHDNLFSVDLRSLLFCCLEGLK